LIESVSLQNNLITALDGKQPGAVWIAPQSTPVLGFFKDFLRMPTFGGRRLLQSTGNSGCASLSGGP